MIVLMLRGYTHSCQTTSEKIIVAPAFPANGWGGENPPNVGMNVKTAPMNGWEAQDSHTAGLNGTATAFVPSAPIASNGVSHGNKSSNRNGGEIGWEGPSRSSIDRPPSVQANHSSVPSYSASAAATAQEAAPAIIGWDTSEPSAPTPSLGWAAPEPTPTYGRDRSSSTVTDPIKPNYSSNSAPQDSGGWGAPEPTPAYGRDRGSSIVDDRIKPNYSSDSAPQQPGGWGAPAEVSAHGVPKPINTSPQQGGGWGARVESTSAHDISNLSNTFASTNLNSAASSPNHPVSGWNGSPRVPLPPQQFGSAAGYAGGEGSRYGSRGGYGGGGGGSFSRTSGGYGAGGGGGGFGGGPSGGNEIPVTGHRWGRAANNKGSQGQMEGYGQRQDIQSHAGSGW